jgi:uncharacterized protein (TIGR02271 family)
MRVGRKNGDRCNPVSSGCNEEITVPLHEESVSVAKQKVATGTVRISTTTKQEKVLVDEALTRESVEVERKPVNRSVDHMPSVREEGDALIFPVVEEILVVERRLFLKEEVWVRRVRQVRRHQEQIDIRKQQAVIKRLSTSGEERH